MGPLEADVVRVVWAAKAPLSVREVLGQLNKSRAILVRYTTVQTVMARLKRKQVLARSRRGRRHVYAAVASDAASIAVSRLLAQFGEAAIKQFSRAGLPGAHDSDGAAPRLVPGSLTGERSTFETFSLSNAPSER